MARAGLTTAKVATAGAELADEVGFDHVTLSELARRCGVQIASLYSHVKNADDLRMHIALVALEEMADRADEALAGRSGRDALIALGNVYRDYAAEHPGRYDASRFPLDTGTAAVSAGPRHSRLVRSVLRGYDVTEPSQTHAVRMLGSQFHGYISLERSGGFEHSGPSSAVSWAEILDVLDTLLQSWPVSRRLNQPTGTTAEP